MTMCSIPNCPGVMGDVENGFLVEDETGMWWSLKRIVISVSSPPLINPYYEATCGSLIWPVMAMKPDELLERVATKSPSAARIMEDLLVGFEMLPQ
jgi:hypothetical protein